MINSLKEYQPDSIFVKTGYGKFLRFIYYPLWAIIMVGVTIFLYTLIPSTDPGLGPVYYEYGLRIFVSGLGILTILNHFNWAKTVFLHRGTVFSKENITLRYLFGEEVIAYGELAIVLGRAGKNKVLYITKKSSNLLAIFTKWNLIGVHKSIDVKEILQYFYFYGEDTEVFNGREVIKYYIENEGKLNNEE